MAAWYWFVIAGVAVLVIGGTIFVLTRGGDEEEAAAAEDGKPETRSLAEIGKDGIKLAVDGSESFWVDDSTPDGFSWIHQTTCDKDVATIEEKVESAKDDKKKDEAEGDDDKEGAKSLQADKDDDKEDKDADKEEAAPKEPASKRWFTVTGVGAGDCELHIALATEDFDWEDEDTQEDNMKELVKIDITISKGDEKEEKKDEEKEEKE